MAQDTSSRVRASDDSAEPAAAGETSGAHRVSWQRKILFRLVCLVAVLLFLEGALSTYSHFFYPRLTQTDATLGWKYHPTDGPIERHDTRNGTVVTNRISINSDGFRDDEFDDDPGTIRVMALGDSMTFGLEADQDQIFPVRLEALLRENFPGKKVDVLNFGITGFGTVQEYLCLQHYEPIYRPDAVVLTMLELNDWADNTAVFDNRFVPHFEREPDGSLVLRDRPGPLQRLKNAVRDYSTLYYVLATKVPFIRDAVTEYMDLDEEATTRLTLEIVERLVTYVRERELPLHVFYACLMETDSERRDAMKVLSEKLDFHLEIVPLVPAERVGGSGHWNALGHVEIAQRMRAALLGDAGFVESVRRKD